MTSLESEGNWNDKYLNMLKNQTQSNSNKTLLNFNLINNSPIKQSENKNTNPALNRRSHYVSGFADIVKSSNGCKDYQKIYNFNDKGT